MLSLELPMEDGSPASPHPGSHFIHLSLQVFDYRYLLSASPCDMILLAKLKEINKEYGVEE